MGVQYNIFAKMPLSVLLEEAKRHQTQKAYLASLGYKNRANAGLSSRMKKEGLTPLGLWPNACSQDVRFPEVPHVFDLMNETHAYVYGFALADGHLKEGSRGRGQLVIKLKESDSPLLEAISSAFPWSSKISRQTRDTNFMAASQTATLLFCSRGLRKQLIALGFPAGRKSEICAPPASAYHREGFWRGMIDGDGSLGFTKDLFPFVSLVSSSEAMVQAYKDHLTENFDLKLGTSRNTRDGVWNLMVTRDKAKMLTQEIYTGGISLPRKAMLAEKMKSWENPFKPRNKSQPV